MYSRIFRFVKNLTKPALRVTLRMKDKGRAQFHPRGLPMKTKLKALIVDGNETILKSVKDILAKEKFDVIQSSGAEDALQILENQNVDVIISELRMPGMDGIDFVKELRQWDGETAIILVSGEVDELEWLEAINCGASALLSKPLNKDKVVKAVQKAIKENEAYSNHSLFPIPD